MRDRRTIVEVIATAALAVDIPINDGDDLRAGAVIVLATGPKFATWPSKTSGTSPRTTASCVSRYTPG